jgi:hypothetical protein
MTVVSDRDERGLPGLPWMNQGVVPHPLAYQIAFAGGLKDTRLNEFTPQGDHPLRQNHRMPGRALRQMWNCERVTRPKEVRIIECPEGH